MEKLDYSAGGLEVVEDHLVRIDPVYRSAFQYLLPLPLVHEEAQVAGRVDGDK